MSNICPKCGKALLIDYEGSTTLTLCECPQPEISDEQTVKELFYMNNKLESKLKICIEALEKIMETDLLGVCGASDNPNPFGEHGLIAQSALRKVQE